MVKRLTSAQRLVLEEMSKGNPIYEILTWLKDKKCSECGSRIFGGSEWRYITRGSREEVHPRTVKSLSKRGLIQLIALHTYGVNGSKVERQHPEIYGIKRSNAV